MDSIESVELNKSLEFVNSDLKRDLEMENSVVPATTVDTFTFGSSVDQPEEINTTSKPEVEVKKDEVKKIELKKVEVKKVEAKKVEVKKVEPTPEKVDEEVEVASPSTGLPNLVETKIPKIEKKKPEESEKIKKTVTGIVSPISYSVYKQLSDIDHKLESDK